MKIQLFLYVCIILFLFNSCFNQENKKDIDKTKTQFVIKGQFMTFQVKINDSIPARGILETGGVLPIVDKLFFDKYLKEDKEYTEKKERVSIFSTKESLVIKVDDTISIEIGKKTIQFSNYEVRDLKAEKINADIVFPIKVKDSSYVWELNFDDRYIKIHDYKDKIDTAGYSAVKIYLYDDKNEKNKILFYLPIRYILNGKTETDTLWCKMDTGNPFDIFIFPRLRDINKPIYHPIIENTKDKKLNYLVFNGNLVKRLISKASFFSFSQSDTVSIRFYHPESPFIPISDYVGLNFVLRYNYFIDLHNSIMYIKPVKKITHIYHKIDDDMNFYGHYDKDRNYVIDSIDILSEGPAYKAGVRKGDAVYWFMGYKMKDIIERPMDYDYIKMVNNYDCYHFKVIREKDTIDLKIHKTF